MFVITKIVVDYDGRVLVREGYKYDGEVALCCGGASKEEKAAAAEQKALTQQQAQYTAQLQQQQSQLFQEDQALYNYLAPQLQAQIQNPAGFTAQEMADLTANNINTTGQQFANAQKQVNLQQATQNMAGLPSGVAAQTNAMLQGAAAGQVAQGQGQINLANSELEQQNKQTATAELLGLESGTGGLSSAFAGQSNQGMGVASSSNQAYFNQAQTMATQGSQFWTGLLGGIVGTGLDALTGGVVGGFGSMASGGGFGKGFGQGVQNVLKGGA